MLFKRGKFYRLFLQVRKRGMKGIYIYIHTQLDTEREIEETEMDEREREGEQVEAPVLGEMI